MDDITSQILSSVPTGNIKEIFYFAKMMSLITSGKVPTTQVLGLEKTTFSSSVKNDGNVVEINVYETSSARHLIRFFISAAIFLIISLMNIKLILKLAYPLFFLNILALILILFIGTETYGATRWIRIAGISLQPSEFIKVSLMLYCLPLISSIKISPNTLPYFPTP